MDFFWLRIISPTCFWIAVIKVSSGVNCLSGGVIGAFSSNLISSSGGEEVVSCDSIIAGGSISSSLMFCSSEVEDVFSSAITGGISVSASSSVCKESISCWEVVFCSIAGEVSFYSSIIVSCSMTDIISFSSSILVSISSSVGDETISCFEGIDSVSSVVVIVDVMLVSGVIYATSDGLLSELFEVIKNMIATNPVRIPVKAVFDNFAENFAGKISRIFPKKLIQNCWSFCKKPGLFYLLGDGSVSKFSAVVSNNPIVPRKTLTKDAFQNGIFSWDESFWVGESVGGWIFLLSSDIELQDKA